MANITCRGMNDIEPVSLKLMDDLHVHQLVVLHFRVQRRLSCAFERESVEGQATEAAGNLGACYEALCKYMSKLQANPWNLGYVRSLQLKTTPKF